MIHYRIFCNFCTSLQLTMDWLSVIGCEPVITRRTDTAIIDTNVFVCCVISWLFLHAGYNEEELWLPENDNTNSNTVVQIDDLISGLYMFVVDKLCICNISVECAYCGFRNNQQYVELVGH